MGDRTVVWSNEWGIERFSFKNNHKYYQYELHVLQGFVKLYSPEYIVFWTIRLQLPSISVGRPYITSEQMNTLPLYTTFCVQLGSDELAFFLYGASNVMSDINYRSTQAASENQTRSNNLMPFTFGGSEIKVV